MAEIAPSSSVGRGGQGLARLPARALSADGASSAAGLACWAWVGGTVSRIWTTHSHTGPAPLLQGASGVHACWGAREVHGRRRAPPDPLEQWAAEAGEKSWLSRKGGGRSIGRLGRASPLRAHFKGR